MEPDAVSARQSISSRRWAVKGNARRRGSWLVPGPRTWWAVISRCREGLPRAGAGQATNRCRVLSSCPRGKKCGYLNQTNPCRRCSSVKTPADPASVRHWVCSGDNECTQVNRGACTPCRQPGGAAEEQGETYFVSRRLTGATAPRKLKVHSHRVDLTVGLGSTALPVAEVSSRSFCTEEPPPHREPAGLGSYSPHTGPHITLVPLPWAAQTDGVQAEARHPFQSASSHWPCFPWRQFPGTDDPNTVPCPGWILQSVCDDSPRVPSPAAMPSR